MPDLGELPLEPEGLVGRVLDTAGAPVAGGRVVLVSSTAVASLASSPIDPTQPPEPSSESTHDEPLEDPIDSGAIAMSAPIDGEGFYRFESLPPEDVFVVAIPADETRLPGGGGARLLQARDSLVGARLDIRLSTRPSRAAAYVGSSTCTLCHGQHRVFGTAHAVGLSVPGRRSYQQDTSAWSDFDAALDRFDEGLTLYFHSCDVDREPPCEVSESEPAPPTQTSFEVVLTRQPGTPRGSPGAYRVTLRNRRNPGEASHAVELTYGGALRRQQFLVRGDAGERQLLPFQYQHDGVVGAEDPRARRWADVGSSRWYDHAAGRLTSPAEEGSFDRRCATCHLTDFALSPSTEGALVASALPSAEGAFDYDGDGRLEAINIGCEGCHGPGSEHVDAGGQGVAIVSPDLLTPGRGTALCGRCHGRPLPAEGGAFRPGDRRSELLAYVTGPEAGPGDLFPSGDARRHRMQYIDHIRSSMYRNGTALVTCTDCHDAHGSPRPHDLRVAPDDNAACTSCHSTPTFVNTRTHVDLRTGADAHRGLEDDDLVCVACHMPPTARGGAAVPGLLDAHPATAEPVQYYLGDLASHRYRTSGFELVPIQPTSVTQACGLCHALTLPNP